MTTARTYGYKKSKLKRVNNGVFEYHLITKDVDKWLTLQALMKNHNIAGITSKQAYDRLYRVTGDYKSALKTVQDCMSVPYGEVQGKGPKTPRAESKLKIIGNINLWPAGSLAHTVR